MYASPVGSCGSLTLASIEAPLQRWGVHGPGARSPPPVVSLCLARPILALWHAACPLWRASWALLGDHLSVPAPHRRLAAACTLLHTLWSAPRLGTAGPEAAPKPASRTISSRVAPAHEAAASAALPEQEVPEQEELTHGQADEQAERSAVVRAAHSPAAECELDALGSGLSALRLNPISEASPRNEQRSSASVEGTSPAASTLADTSLRATPTPAVATSADGPTTPGVDGLGARSMAWWLVVASPEGDAVLGLLPQLSRGFRAISEEMAALSSLLGCMQATNTSPAPLEWAKVEEAFPASSPHHKPEPPEIT